MSEWRVIITDSETLNGVALVCPQQREPGGGHDGGEYFDEDWRELAEAIKHYRAVGGVEPRDPDEIDVWLTPEPLADGGGAT